MSEFKSSGQKWHQSLFNSRWAHALGCVVSILLLAKLSVAQSEPVPTEPEVILTREQNIQALESLFLDSNLLAQDSPLIQSIVTPLKQANRKLNETEWQAIAQELSQHIKHDWLKPRSPFDVGFRQALEPISDEDCALLVKLLNSSAWRQFEGQLKTPVFKKSVDMMLREDADDVNNAIDTLVKAHHLRLPQ